MLNLGMSGSNDWYNAHLGCSIVIHHNAFLVTRVRPLLIAVSKGYRRRPIQQDLLLRPIFVREDFTFRWFLMTIVRGSIDRACPSYRCVIQWTWSSHERWCARVRAIVWPRESMGRELIGISAAVGGVVRLPLANLPIDVVVFHLVRVARTLIDDFRAQSVVRIIQLR